MLKRYAKYATAAVAAVALLFTATPADAGGAWSKKPGHDVIVTPNGGGWS